MLCVLAMASATATEEKAEKGIPSIDLGTAKLKLGGFVQIYESLADGEADFDLAKLLLCADLKSKSEKWGGLLVLDFSELQQERAGNWLRFANVWYKTKSEFTLRLGRIFLAGGYTTPGPTHNETVSYPTCDPIGLRAWGFQVEKLWGGEEDGVLFLADVSGLSKPIAFDDPQNWVGVESSCRVQKNFGKGNWFAGTAQWSEDYLRLALDSQFHLTENFYLRGALYWAKNDSRTSDLVGAYAIAVWEPINRFELHGMIDVWDLQAKKVDFGESWSSTENNIAVTLGTRTFLTKDRNLTATFDVVIPVTDQGQETDPRIEGRINFRF